MLSGTIPSRWGWLSMALWVSRVWLYPLLHRKGLLEGRERVAKRRWHWGYLTSIFSLGIGREAVKPSEPEALCSGETEVYRVMVCFCK